MRCLKCRAEFEAERPARYCPRCRSQAGRAKQKAIQRAARKKREARA